MEWKVDESVFQQQEEKELWDAYKAVKNELTDAFGVKTFVEASKVLEAPLESFFNSVFVMDEDDTIRKNRLAMMRDIATLPRGLLDFKSLPNF